MKKIILILAAAATLATAASAQKATRTPDPRPTAENIAMMYARIDTNHDRRMTKFELQTFGVSNNIGTIVTNSKWKRADVNHNGWLSEAELAKYLYDAHDARQRRAAGR